MDSSSGNLNPSSIIDLKAELHKKYISFNKAKLDQNNQTTVHKPLKRKLEQPSAKKVKSTPIVKPPDQNTEEELALQKSRKALEAKAKLYEKIVSNNVLIDDEENETYLVDFQRKVVYSSPELENVSEQNASNAESTSSSSENMFLKNTSSSQARIFKQNEDQDMEKNSDPFTHYQSVHQNEVRDHGAGYFAFSTDEAERKKQMEELNLMRQETEKRRLAKEKLLQKRKSMIQNRLAKICERKNIDQSVLQAFTKEEKESDATQSQETDVASIPLPENQPKPEVKKVKVRPWDIGKNNLQHFVPAKNKIKSQNEWIEEKREERRSEFAPPSFPK